MEDLEQKLHRTWVQALVDLGFTEIASVAIDSEIHFDCDEYEDFNRWISVPKGIYLDIPTVHFSFAKKNEDAIVKTLVGVCKGHVYDSDGRSIDSTDFPVSFRVALLEVEEGWRDVTRNIIVGLQDPNQGVITEKIFERRGKRPFVYNEMKFASKSEIRIAQELEAHGVLFFPLPLAVRQETGNSYQDHREVDFIICSEGVWGILEVAYHVDRYEQDKEKDAWFKKSGILCIEHYTAERCFNSPKEVVTEYLEILAKHKR